MPAPGLLCLANGGAYAAAGFHVGVFDEHHVKQAETVVVSSSRNNGALFEEAKSRRGLSGVKQTGAASFDQ